MIIFLTYPNWSPYLWKVCAHKVALTAHLKIFSVSCHLKYGLGLGRKFIGKIQWRDRIWTNSTWCFDRWDQECCSGCKVVWSKCNIFVAAFSHSNSINRYFSFLPSQCENIMNGPIDTSILLSLNWEIIFQTPSERTGNKKVIRLQSLAQRTWMTD